MARQDNPGAPPTDTFIIGVSCFLRVGPRLIFEIQKPGKWTQRPGKPRLIGMGCIGGSLEEGESVIEALQREAREEIGCDIALGSARTTVDISPNGVTVLENCLFDDLRPAAIWETDPRNGYIPGAKVVVFVGEAEGDPQPLDLPAIVLADPSLISDIGTQTLTVAEARARGADVRQQIDMPPDGELCLASTLKFAHRLMGTPHDLTRTVSVG